MKMSKIVNRGRVRDYSRRTLFGIVAKSVRLRFDL